MKKIICVIPILLALGASNASAIQIISIDGAFEQLRRENPWFGTTYSNFSGIGLSFDYYIGSNIGFLISLTCTLPVNVTSENAGTTISYNDDSLFKCFYFFIPTSLDAFPAFAFYLPIGDRSSFLIGAGTHLNMSLGSITSDYDSKAGFTSIAIGVGIDSTLYLIANDKWGFNVNLKWLYDFYEADRGVSFDSQSQFKGGFTIIAGIGISFFL
jgi:hypothetical protein